MSVTIREARPDDAEAILGIVNEAISSTTALWTEIERTLEEQLDWLEQKSTGGWPVLVATDAHRVIGFVTYGPFRPQPGYRATVEHSVYVAPAARAQGVGRLLLGAIVERARADGRHILVGGISSDNEPSLRLHERLGFVEVGRMPQVGRKFGRWLDLVLVQLELDQEA